ncbi:MAG TPA: hypothetical protein VFZ25_06870 [Chloroflexota bacterium]|nr:hypothetical protein [Chloroflexota bacterium]
MYAEGILSRRGVSAWQSPWLLSKRWDLTYISLSAILVPTPYILFQVLNGLGLAVSDANTAVDIIVALIVGGPHMVSTYTLTFFDSNFTHRHRLYVGLALALPIMVTVLAFRNLTLLLTIFMMWASVHVLHQIAYIADCYRVRGSETHSLVSKGLDYAVIFTSLYPMAMVKLVNNSFVISDTRITIPFLVGQVWAIYAAQAVFFICLALWVRKTLLEMLQHRANFPKTLLLAITIVLAYFVPASTNLDVAFQGMNVWHSFQYLGLTWYLNRLRQEHGEITSPVVNRVSGSNRGPLYYLLNVGMTLAVAVMFVVLHFVLQVSSIQSYYIVILSCLLVHYYFDHFMFLRVNDLVRA